MECSDFLSEIIASTSIDEWMTNCRPYQKEIIQSLYKNMSPEVAIETYFNASGPAHTACYGGEITNRKIFSERFTNEFNKFICGHPDYKSEQETINTNINTAKDTLIAFVASILSSKFSIFSTSNYINDLYHCENGKKRILLRNKV